MVEQRSTMATIWRFGCPISLTPYYLLYVVGINSTYGFLNINKEILKTPHNNLSSAMDEAISVDIRVDYGVMTIQELYCMVLATNLITNLGVTHDVTLLGTLDDGAVHNFNKFMQHMASTKAITYSAELSKLPSNTQLYKSEINNWCTTVEEELYQKTLADGIYTLGYVICTSKSPVDYGDVEKQ